MAPEPVDWGIEPASVLLMGVGLMGLLAFKKRKS